MQRSHLPGQVANVGWFVVWWGPLQPGVTHPSSWESRGWELLRYGQQTSHKESLFSHLEQGRCSPAPLCCLGAPRPARGHGAAMPGWTWQLVGLPSFGCNCSPPRHSTEFGHSRSLQKSQAQQGTAGPGEFIQGKRSRGPARRWSGDGARQHRAARIRGGGMGGPNPAAAGAVARHGDPWHGFRRPAAARTVRVSAPLAVGEQTC